MTLKYLLCIILILSAGGILFSQGNVSTNVDAAGSLVDESLIPLNNKLLILGKDNLYSIMIDDNEAGEYILDNIKRKFADYRIVFRENSDSIKYRIIFKNPIITTRYKKIFTDNILGTKKVEREVAVSYDADVIDNTNSSVIYNLNFNKKFKDDFNLENLNYIENQRYKFSRSSLPDENNADKILFPSLIIGASAAAIILFFVIRSK
ncbi:MAG: hypothetical protein SGI89_06605 [bacterium]|nr:hypothetical protein [bacterium]